MTISSSSMMAEKASSMSPSVIGHSAPDINVNRTIGSPSETVGISHTMNPTFSTSVGFDSITVALLGRSNPIGVMLAAILFGAMRAGAGPMQINAGVPVELVDVIQALILLFLIANVVFRRLLRLRGVRGSEQTGFETITKSYGREAAV